MILKRKYTSFISLSLLFPAFVLVGMQNEMATEVVASITKKSKQDDNDVLISDWVRALLTEDTKNPLGFPTNGFDTIIAKHMLGNEAIAFISKQLMTRSEKMGKHSSKPFELNHQFFAMLDRKKEWL